MPNPGLQSIINQAEITVPKPGKSAEPYPAIEQQLGKSAESYLAIETQLGKSAESYPAIEPQLGKSAESYPATEPQLGKSARVSRLFRAFTSFQTLCNTYSIK